MNKRKFTKVFAALLAMVMLCTNTSLSVLARGSTGAVSDTPNKLTGNTQGTMQSAVDQTDNPGAYSATGQSTATYITNPSVPSPGNSSCGTKDPNRYNYLRIGLGMCNNEPVEITTDPEQYASNIQEYASKYYVTAFGPCYYYNLGTATDMYSGVDGYGLNAIQATPEKCPGCYQVLQCIANNQADNEFVKKAADGSFYIVPDANKIAQLMDELCEIDELSGQANRNLRNLYTQAFQAGSNIDTAVVIVIEPCLAIVEDNGEKYIASVADMVYRIGGESKYQEFLSTNLTKYANEDVVNASNGDTASVSITDKAFSDILGIRNAKKTSGEVPWPNWVTKRFFGTRWHDGKVDIGTDMRLYAYVAENAWQTRSEGGQRTGINGCTVVAIAARDIDPAVPPAQAEGNAPEGKYDWHIDAEDAVRNPTGHREDQIVKTKLGFNSAIHKGVNIGALNIYQENSFQWRNWIDSLGATEVTLKVGTYHTSGDAFSTDPATIRSGGATRTGNGVEGTTPTPPMTGSGTVLSYTMPKEEFYDYIEDEDCGIPIATDVVGPEFTNGRLAVSYATTVSVTVAGQVVNLYNEDAHYIVYTSADNMTYTFQQIASPASAQIKQGGLGTERYEAMAGTPTTEDLFITWGGDQYIVNMQYSYNLDDYIRTYKLTTPEIPNFDYYRLEGFTGTGSRSADSASDSGNSTTSSSSGYDCTAYNQETTRYNAADTAVAAQARNNAKAFLNSLGFNNNSGTYGSMYSACVSSVPQEWLSFVDSKTRVSDANNSSAEVTLFEGVDPETGESFKISGHMEYYSSSSGPTHNHSSEWTCGFPANAHTHSSSCYSSQSVLNCSLAHTHTSSCYTTGQVLTCGNRPNNTHQHNSSCSQRFDCNSAWSRTAYFTLVLTCSGIGSYCLSAPQSISETQTIQQTFHDVKYMDIVEAHVWRIAEGTEVGAGAILAEPVSSATEVISAAVGELGYAFYDADSSNPHNWDSGKEAYVCLAADDLERVGRLVNSYNTGMAEFTVGQYFNNDAHAFKITDTGDTVTMVYDPSAQGGRSSRSLHAFFMQAVAHTFYVNGKGAYPYSNTIACTSDILSLLAGDTSGNAWLTFCAWDFDSNDYTAEGGLKQYILTPNASKIDALGLFGTTFSINGKDSRTASDSAIPADGYLNDQRYNGGDV